MSAKPQRRFADLASAEGFESGWNRLQTVVEVAVALIVVAGLAGLFGDDPISPRTVTFAGVPITMTYQCILRRTAAARIEFRTVAPLAAAALEIELPHQLATEIDVVATSPRSDAMRADKDGIVYRSSYGPETTTWRGRQQRSACRRWQASISCCRGCAADSPSSAC